MYLYMCIVNPGPFHFKEAAFSASFSPAGATSWQICRTTRCPDPPWSENVRARRGVGRGRSWWSWCSSLTTLIYE